MNRFREWRTKNNVDVIDIAEKINMSKQHVYDLEKGKRRFNEDILKALNEHYGLSADYILGLESNNKYEIGFAEGTDIGNMKVKDFLQVINSLVSDN